MIPANVSQNPRPDTLKAYRWTAAGNSYITYGTFAATEIPQAPPITFAAWVRNTSATYNDRNMIQLQDKDSAADYYRMSIGDDSAPTTLPFQCFVSGASDLDVADTTRESVINRWHHSCARFFSDALRKTSIDGGNTGTNTNTTTNPTAAMDSISIGREMDTSAGDSWEGNIIWPAIWDVALTDAEVKQLAAGASPLIVRPQNLKFFAPLDGRTDDKRCLITKRVPEGVHATETDPFVLVNGRDFGPSLPLPKPRILSLPFGPVASISITDVANSGETPGSGTETWDDGSTGNVITGTGFV